MSTTVNPLCVLFICAFNKKNKHTLTSTCLGYNMLLWSDFIENRFCLAILDPKLVKCRQLSSSATFLLLRNFRNVHDLKRETLNQISEQVL